MAWSLNLQSALRHTAYHCTKVIKTIKQQTEPQEKCPEPSHRFAILSCVIQRLDEMQRILFHEPFKCLPSEITAANCNEE